VPSTTVTRHKIGFPENGSAQNRHSGNKQSTQLKIRIRTGQKQLMHVTPRGHVVPSGTRTRHNSDFRKVARHKIGLAESGSAQHRISGRWLGTKSDFRS
jgi:hypothetical protein